MNTKSIRYGYLAPVFLGLLSACSGGDINFPGLQPVVTPGPRGTIQLEKTAYDATEGTVVNILVARSGGNYGVVSVDYATADATAEGGSDYGAVNGRLTWPSGTGGNRTISIPITDDNSVEGPESFTVTLTNVAWATLGANSSATVSIIDNDTAALSAVGAITDLKRVTVNGIRYDTNATNVTVNGLPANVSDLKLGQVVAIEGAVNFSDATGRADQISYFATAIGPVENIDAEQSRLTVMGQTVLTNADTVFDTNTAPGGLAGLTVGSNAQVSGFLNADGEILATRIQPNTANSGAQIIGSVAGLDFARMMFTLNELSVDYGSAALIDLPDGMPANGMLVLAKGSLINGALVVEEIENIDDSARDFEGSRQ